jgi:hypothetical protein
VWGQVVDNAQVGKVFGEGPELTTTICLNSLYSTIKLQFNHRFKFDKLLHSFRLKFQRIDPYKSRVGIITSKKIGKTSGRCDRSRAP